MREQIYHITTQADWDAAQPSGLYRHPSLTAEGFIHCSYPEQILGVANRYFQGQDHLMLLAINRSQTNCDVIDEDLSNANQQYPHIYGPVPVNAVVDVIPFPRNEDGSFSLPGNL